jgi:hypothetical protein
MRHRSYTPRTVRRSRINQIQRNGKILTECQRITELQTELRQGQPSCPIKHALPVSVSNGTIPALEEEPEWLGQPFILDAFGALTNRFEGRSRRRDTTIALCTVWETQNRVSFNRCSRRTTSACHTCRTRNDDVPSTGGTAGGTGTAFRLAELPPAAPPEASPRATNSLVTASYRNPRGV